MRERGDYDGAGGGAGRDDDGCGGAVKEGGEGCGGVAGGGVCGSRSPNLLAY